MEMEANELFDSYRELYFEGGTSSVYLWDLENGFAGCFLIKKSEFLSSRHFLTHISSVRCGREQIRQQRVLGQYSRH
jgi:hypothetical protein